jgi:hypothetical protein
MVASPGSSGSKPPLLRTVEWPLCLPVSNTLRVGAQTHDPRKVA